MMIYSIPTPPQAHKGCGSSHGGHSNYSVQSSNEDNQQAWAGRDHSCPFPPYMRPCFPCADESRESIVSHFFFGARDIEEERRSSPHQENTLDKYRGLTNEEASTPKKEMVSLFANTAVYPAFCCHNRRTHPVRSISQHHDPPHHRAAAAAARSVCLGGGSSDFQHQQDVSSSPAASCRLSLSSSVDLAHYY